VNADCGAFASFNGRGEINPRRKVNNPSFMPMDGVTTDADGPTHDSRIIGGDSVHPSVFYKPSIWSADNISLPHLYQPFSPAI
jgi:hypothetical protein